MSDLNEWLKERRRIHDAAPRGAWETSSAERDAFYNLPALLTAAENVLKRHPFQPFTAKIGYCATCRESFPCPTIRAIEGAINDQ